MGVCWNRGTPKSSFFFEWSSIKPTIFGSIYGNPPYVGQLRRPPCISSHWKVVKITLRLHWGHRSCNLRAPRGAGTSFLEKREIYRQKWWDNGILWDFGGFSGISLDLRMGQVTYLPIEWDLIRFKGILWDLDTILGDGSFHSRTKPTC